MSKKYDGDRLCKLEEKVAALSNRMLWVERAARVLCGDHQNKYMNEQQLAEAIRTARHISNAFREVRGHLKRYGNEFDREPHMPNPDHL